MSVHVLLPPFIKQCAAQNETAIFKYEGADNMSICQQVSVPIVHPSGEDWKNMPDLEIRVISPPARARSSSSGLENMCGGEMLEKDGLQGNFVTVPCLSLVLCSRRCRHFHQMS